MKFRKSLQMTKQKKMEKKKEMFKKKKIKGPVQEDLSESKEL